MLKQVWSIALRVKFELWYLRNLRSVRTLPIFQTFSLLFTQQCGFGAKSFYQVEVHENEVAHFIRNISKVRKKSQVTYLFAWAKTNVEFYINLVFHNDESYLLTFDFKKTFAK